MNLTLSCQTMGSCDSVWTVYAVKPALVTTSVKQ